jgi:hypothetical protein
MRQPDVGGRCEYIQYIVFRSRQEGRPRAWGFEASYQIVALKEKQKKALYEILQLASGLDRFFATPKQRKMGRLKVTAKAQVSFNGRTGRMRRG